MNMKCSVCVYVCMWKWVWLHPSRLQMAHSEAKSSNSRYDRSFRYRSKTQKLTPVLCIITRFVLLYAEGFHSVFWWPQRMFHPSNILLLFRVTASINKQVCPHLLPLSTSFHLYYSSQPPLHSSQHLLVHSNLSYLLTATLYLLKPITLHPFQLPPSLFPFFGTHPSTIPHSSQSLLHIDSNRLPSIAHQSSFITSASIIPNPLPHPPWPLALLIPTPSQHHPAFTPIHYTFSFQPHPPHFNHPVSIDQLNPILLYSRRLPSIPISFLVQLLHLLHYELPKHLTPSRPYKRKK